jgi:hypothetical protein
MVMTSQSYMSTLVRGGANSQLHPDDLQLSGNFCARVAVAIQAEYAGFITIGDGRKSFR